MHTKMSLNVRHRVVSPAGIAERTCISPNQAQTLARERVTRQPPTLDCRSTANLAENALESEFRFTATLCFDKIDAARTLARVGGLDAC